MIRTDFIKTSLVLASLCTGAAASANIVDFTGLPDGDAANPLTISGATFSSPGFNVIAFGSLCPSPTSDSYANCENPLQVDFETPASAIGFSFAGNNDLVIGSDVGDVQIFDGATLLGTVDMLVTDMDVLSPDFVALTGYANVTRLLLTTTDFGGLIYDNFSFTLATPAVPEPATWALLVGGFALVGSALRRRPVAVSFV